MTKKDEMKDVHQGAGWGRRPADQYPVPEAPSREEVEIDERERRSVFADQGEAKAGPATHFNEKR